LTTRRVPVLCTRSLPMSCRFLLSVIRPPPRSPLFPYPTLFRSAGPRRLILEPIAANVVALLLRLESPDRRRVVAYIGERALRPAVVGVTLHGHGQLRAEPAMQHALDAYVVRVQAVQRHVHLDPHAVAECDHI